MDLDPRCIFFGPLVSWAVDLLRRIPLLRRYPQLIALLLAGFTPILLGQFPAPFGLYIICVLQAFAGSIVTHETVSRWTGLGRLLSGGVSRDE
jgi:hypothetical protein